jgi:DNA-binding response OmpR family regulator
MMPGLHGIEVVQALRQDPATADSPIMMVSARGHATDQARGRSVGISAYLVKPFSPLELLRSVREILG